MKILCKGYANKKDIQRFCPCGYKCAKSIYDSIVDDITKDGHKVSTLGIPTKRLLQFLEISEDEIMKLTEYELNMNFKRLSSPLTA